MTALDIAQKDFEDAIRSRALWVITAVFIGVMTLSALLPTIIFDDPTPRLAVAFIQGPATEFLLPLIALMVGYRSIVGERELGSLKFLLALPHSRLDVLLGKLIGRSTVVAVAIVLGFITTWGFITLVYGPPPIIPLVSYTVLSVLAGSTFVAITVGVSASVSTRFQAISVLVGGFILLTWLWTRILSGVHYFIAGEFPGPDPPWWVHLLSQLNPIESYSMASIAILPETPYLHFDVDDAGVMAEQGAVITIPESTYVFYNLEFMLAVLMGWTVVSIGIGYLRFQSADLT